MKYRRLTGEQLDSLQKEFVEFLVINGIVADDWQKLKDSEPEKADEMVNLFSDVVFESIMRQVDFIEWRSVYEIRAFQCLSDKMVLVGMKAEEGSPVNFTNADFINSAMADPPEGIQVYTTEKSYAKIREIEIFEMLENGCVISDGKIFKAIAMAL